LPTLGCLFLLPPPCLRLLLTSPGCFLLLALYLLGLPTPGCLFLLLAPPRGRSRRRRRRRSRSRHRSRLLLTPPGSCLLMLLPTLFLLGLPTTGYLFLLLAHPRLRLLLTPPGRFVLLSSTLGLFCLTATARLLLLLAPPRLFLLLPPLRLLLLLAPSGLLLVSLPAPPGFLLCACPGGPAVSGRQLPVLGAGLKGLAMRRGEQDLLHEVHLPLLREGAHLGVQRLRGRVRLAQEHVDHGRHLLREVVLQHGLEVAHDVLEVADLALHVLARRPGPRCGRRGSRRAGHRRGTRSGSSWRLRRRGLLPAKQRHAGRRPMGPKKKLTDVH